MSVLNKETIIHNAEKIFASFTTVANGIPAELFFQRPENKWSAAENVQHLIISTNTTTLAFTLPKILVRWIGGRPNRLSRTYEALVEKYQKKLAAGGKASGRFIPKPLSIKDSREQLMGNWQKATDKFIKALKNNRSESDLENYIVKHPLLGRITLRELCYFTIYHTEHHLKIINKQ